MPTRTAQGILLAIGVILILAKYVGAPTFEVGVALCFIALGLTFFVG